jgi:competence protein ComEC
MILATGTTALAAQPDGRLTIDFLSVGPAGYAEGEAILIRTPDGKTMLIDGGMDPPSQGQELDSRLPFWQRSLDVVMLTNDRMDHLAGLQDVVSRYQVGEVLDAGMLHPTTGYALWRRTITQRGLHYLEERQGTTESVGTQVALQVLWLLSTIDPGYLQADVVQVVGQVGKDFPVELNDVLQAAHPALLLITPSSLSPKQRKEGEKSTVLPASTQVLSEAKDDSAMQVMQTAQLGTLEISSNGNGWTLQPG